jgi:hypothetical protein
MNLVKNLSSFVVIAVALCFSGISINPASSSEVTENNHDEILISQLRGHDTYEGEAQLEWQGYSLGRVVGKSGNMMSIKAEDGTVFQARNYENYYTNYINPGSDVLIGKDEDGGYHIVKAAESEWISYLESDYSFKRNMVASKTLNERTAAIWSEIEASSSTTVSQRLDSQTRTEIVQEREVQEVAPVRGLW